MGLAGRPARRPPGAVVVNVDHQGVLPVDDADDGVRAARVPGAVGQRLLDDPVGSQVDVRRQRDPLAAFLDPDGQPGGGRGVGQVAQPGQARGRCPGSPLVHRAQHAQYRAQLDQGLPADLVDGGQGGAGPVRLAVHQVQRGVGLDVDDRDVVRHHVVQVPRDPHPFLAGPAAQLLLTALLERSRPLAPGPDDLGDGQQEQQQDRQPHREPGAGVAGAADQPGRPYRCDVADDQGCDRRRPLPGLHRGEEGHDQREPDQVRLAGHARPDRYREGDGQHADRVAAAGNQRRPPGGEQEVGADPGGGLAMVPVRGREGPADRYRDHGDGDRDVSGPAPGGCAPREQAGLMRHVRGQVRFGHH